MDVSQIIQIVIGSVCGILLMAVGWVFKEVIGLKTTVSGIQARSVAESEAIKHRLDSLSEWLKALNSKMDALSIQFRNGQKKT